MLIRRQDKKAIVNIETCRVLYIGKTISNRFTIHTEKGEQLGTYKTEERAMEVLDMIAKKSAENKATEILRGLLDEEQSLNTALLTAEEIEKMWYVDMPEE
jgi:hypothetical protein